MTVRFLKQPWFMPLLFVLFLGGLSACIASKPLIVPVTPPSEDNENPGPDAPPVSGSSCRTAETCFKEGLQRWADNDHDGARAVLDNLRFRFPYSIWAPRSAFLLGRWSAEIGSPFADHYFEGVRGTLPMLKPYIHYYAALGHLKGHRFGKALEVLGRFKADFPDSILVKPAEILSAKALLGLGRCDLAFREFNTRGKLPPAEILLMKADCAEKEGDSDLYARFLQEIWFYKSGTEQAEEAGRRLDGLRAQGRTLPEPSLEARLKKASTLMAAARFEEAEAAFASLANDFPGENRDSLRVRQGEALFRQRKNEEALRLFEEVAEESTTPGEVRKSLFWLARIAVRQDEDTRLLEIEKELAEMAPGSPQRIRALFYVGDAFDDSGDREKASKIYRTLMENYPATRTAKESTWRLGWMAYRHGDFGEAIRVFRRFAQRRPSDPANARYWYWIGRSADQSGKPALAAQAYEKTCDLKRRSLYCQLVMSRIQSGLSTASGAIGVSFSPKKGTQSLNGAAYLTQAPEAKGLSLSGSPEYLAAMELLAMQMIPEATRELALLARKYKDPGSILYLSRLFSKIGDSYRSMRLVRLYFSDWIVDKNEETPFWFWELAFPSSLVVETLEKYPVSGMDPYLVSAVAREESAFNPEVISAAGAIGLMQLMPYTGKRVARETGLGDVGVEDLKDPVLNIRIGSRYLRNLIRQFDGNWVLAVAAYNAGPEVVSKWVGDGIEDIEEFVESIPYKETRNYTKRVSRSYYEYRRISKPETPEASRSSYPFFP